MRRCFTTTLLFVICASTAFFAQETTGTISGTVTDKTGAVVNGATVTVTDIDRNKVIRTVKTEAGGHYVAGLLPVGRYKVAVGAPGFKTFETTGIQVNVSDRVAINPKLDAGAKDEVVTVTADALRVDTQSAAATGLVNGTQIRELSLTARNYEQLVSLQPGVSSAVSDTLYVGVETPGGGTNEIDFSINGNRFSQNNWTVDGADNVDRGGNFSLLNTPSVDAIEEFKVQRSAYGPEYGRSAGGQINVITRSGTSNFHGTAYEFFRNDALNANGYLNKHFSDPTQFVPRPTLRYNDFGWTLGGPVYIPGHYNKEKNKTFFFYSEEIRRVITDTNNTVTVPNANERNGIFDFTDPRLATGGLCVTYDPSSGACTATAANQAQFDAYVASIGGFNPAAQAYLTDVFSHIPNPQDPVEDQLTESGKNIFNYRQEIFKIDHTFSPRLALSARYINDHIPTTNPTGLFEFTEVYGYATTVTNSPGRNFLVHATMTLQPTLLNEAGYSWSYGGITSETVGTSTYKNSPNVAGAITLPFANTLQRIPNLGFSDMSGLAGFGPYRDFNHNHQVYDNLSWAKGRHTLKFGFSYNWYQKNENDAGANPSTGNFGFYDTPPVGDPNHQQEWASFLLGNVSGFTQSKNDFHAQVRQHTMEMYAQDEFRLRPNLSLTYGLRYTYYGQPFDAQDRAANFDPALYNPANAPQLDPSNGTVIPGTGQLYNGVIITDLNRAAASFPTGAAINSPFGRALANRDANNFAPRIGVSWDPFNKGKTAIRGGWGMFYDAPAIGFFENNTFSNPPFVGIVNIPPTATTPPDLFQNPASGTASVDTEPFFMKGIDTHWKLPWTEMWSADIQQELPKQIILDVGYYGSIGRNLLGIEDINQPQPGAYVAAGIPQGSITADNTDAIRMLSLVRPFQGYGAINVTRTIFKSQYNSLQVSAQKSFSGGSLVSLNYTWSKSLTDAPNDFYTPQNNQDLRAEWGPSDFDRRHIFSANFVYEFPWLKAQHGFSGKVLGGWEMSGIVSYNSGLFYTANCVNTDAAGLGLLDPNANFSFGGGSSRQGLCVGRPDQVANPNTNAPHTADNWVQNENNSVFNPNPAGLLPGNERRGTIAGPGLARWDLSLFKNLKLTERTGMQFRIEGFNVFNQANFEDFNLDATSDTFGQVQSTHEPRIIQLGVKFNF
jgi:hypothetical protein